MGKSVRTDRQRQVKIRDLLHNLFYFNPPNFLSFPAHKSKAIDLFLPSVRSRVFVISCFK